MEESKDKLTVEQENAIWWAVQWLFKKENKNRNVHRDEFFKQVYSELN